MIYISHRGNINGRLSEYENRPSYIERAIKMGYDVEVDVWFVDGELFLGHDEPQYNIGVDWVDNISNRLWVHCKNVEAISFFNKHGYDINYFWHEKDTLTLTSKNYIWAFPGKQIIKNSIAVLPEIFNDDISKCIGICSDYIKNYKQ